VCGCPARDSRALGSGPPEAGPRSRPEVEWGLITRFPAGNGADAPLDTAGPLVPSELGPTRHPWAARAQGIGPPYRPKPGPRSRPEVEWGLITRFLAENEAYAPTRHRGAAHAERTPVKWGLITRYPAENEAYAPTQHPRAASGPASWPTRHPRAARAQGIGPPYRPKPGPRSRPEVEWGLITRFPAENGAYAPTRHPRGRPRRANPSQVGANHPLPRRKRGVCPHSTPAGGRVIPARIRQGQPGAPCEQPRYRVKVFLRSAQNRLITPSRRAESPALT
jgi:hypothetical protein